MRKNELRRALFPNLTSNSGRQRFGDVTSGRGTGRVNLPSAIKRFVRTNFPDFKFHNSDPDEHHFRQAISDDIVLTIDFERVHHFGMGKTYSVWLGAKHPQATGTRLRHNLLEFFDRTRMDWCYGSADQLDACLQETKALLSLALPPFERAYRFPREHELIAPSTDLPAIGKLDFHHAANLASATLMGVYPQFRRLESASYKEIVGPNRSAAESRLSSDADTVWRLGFADDEAERSMCVDVPSSGTLRFALGDMSFVREGDVMRQARSRMYENELLAMPPSTSAATAESPLDTGAGSHLLATHRLMDLVNDSGGREFLAEHRNCILSIFLRDENLDRTQVTWRVNYTALEARSTFMAVVDAHEGVVMSAKVVD